MSKKPLKTPHKQGDVSQETKDEALLIAKGTQKPGQTKEQTKLIAQGIQHGIYLYKKKQKSKARDLDKKLKKATSQLASADDQDSLVEEASEGAQAAVMSSSLLPWALLLLTWFGIGYLGFFNV